MPTLQMIQKLSGYLGNVKIYTDGKPKGPAELHLFWKG